jgi:hypothetical protein
MDGNTKTLAKRFIEQQLAIMKKYGGQPQLDPDQYEKAVQQTQRTLEAMRRRKPLAAGR